MVSWMATFKPIIAQLAAQMSYVGMNIIAKIALGKDMNHFVFVAYKESAASIIMGTLAYFLERNKRPAMTYAIFWQIFVLAFCGITAWQNLYFAGLTYTSATFASAIANLIPVFIFVMAAASGREKLDMKSKYGQAKVVGAIVCVGGAMLMTLYTGPVLLTTPNGFRISTWIMGTLMLVIGCLFSSGWVTFQDPVVRKYPAQLSLAAIMTFQGAVLSILVALFFEPKASAWKLKWGIELLSVVYSGILCSSFALCVQIYCIRLKGPVFVAMFTPTSTIMVAILEHLILGVSIYLGSLLGTILIITGLYTVLWGKAKTQTMETDGLHTNTHCNIDIRQPLLQEDASLEHTADSKAKISIG